MRPYFSEFSYAFALTYELVNQAGANLVGFPMFPSLIQEGQPGGGYDLRLPIVGAPIYLQFKRSDYLKTSRASQWSLFNSAYYRFYLRSGRYSQQHQLLLDLESDPTESKLVLYAAPIFHTESQLSYNFLASRIVDNSAFFSPSDIGILPDDLEHCIAFNDRSNIAYLCSEPKKIRMTFAGHVLMESFPKVIKEYKRTIDKEYFSILFHALMDILGHNRIRVNFNQIKDSLKIQMEDPSEMDLSIYLLRTFFGAELYIVQV